MKTDEEKLSLATLYQGTCYSVNKSVPGGGRANDYDWELVEKFPLSNFSEPERWLKWYGIWREIYIHEGEDRFQDVMSSVTDDPIIIVKWKDGRYYVWDGNHRLAIAFIFQRQYIKSLVGTLK